MPDAMLHTCTSQCSGHCSQLSTLLTQRNATHSRIQDQGSPPLVLSAPRAVDNDDSGKFLILKRSSPESGHHKFWRVYFVSNGKRTRVASYVRWDLAVLHVETAVRRFGRGYL